MPENLLARRVQKAKKEIKERKAQRVLLARRVQGVKKEIKVIREKRVRMAP